MKDRFADAGNVIDDFLLLLATSATEKKALRVMLVKFTKYQAARQMQEAA